MRSRDKELSSNGIILGQNDVQLDVQLKYINEVLAFFELDGQLGEIRSDEICNEEGLGSHVLFGHGIFWRSIDINGATFHESMREQASMCPHGSRLLPAQDALVDEFIIWDLRDLSG